MAKFLSSTPMTAEEFRALSLEQRYEVLKSKGDYVASRFFTGFHVHLYALDGFFVEAWQRIGLNSIQWIEVVSSDSTINSYLDNIDVS
jgi:hypothetical protein